MARTVFPAEVEELRRSWPTMSRSERVAAFHSLPRAVADDFFLELSSREQAELVVSLPEGERRLWVRLLPPDDVADLIQEAPEEAREGLLNLLGPVTRREVNALLAYEEDAAGGLMNPRFARLRPDMSVDEAISYLRRQSDEVETIYYAYVLAPDQRLLGVLSFRDLFAAARNATVRDLMRTDFVAVPDAMDQEALANLFAKLRLLAIPVVDASSRMEGIVTVDDIVQVVEEEASEDIQKIGGMEALEAPYLEIGFWRMARKRGGWLALLFLGEMLTAAAMSRFEYQIAHAVVLALFVPLIISSGGNSGSQAATLVIRAMAVGEIGLRDWWRVMRRELGAGLVLGGFLALIGAARILIWGAATAAYGGYAGAMALTISLSLIAVVLFGTAAGSMLPFLLRRVGVDPATASTPFIATLVDVSGVLIYFTIAGILLAGRLL
jgi:magnesium transporter